MGVAIRLRPQSALLRKYFARISAKQISSTSLPGKLVGRMLRLGGPESTGPVDLGPDLSEEAMKAMVLRKRQHRLHVNKERLGLDSQKELKHDDEDKDDDADMEKQKGGRTNAGVDSMSKLDVAATRIQAAGRGHLSRKTAKQAARERMCDNSYFFYDEEGCLHYLDPHDMKEAAAITIQSHARGMILRETMKRKEIEEMAKKIESEQERLREMQVEALRKRGTERRRIIEEEKRAKVEEIAFEHVVRARAARKLTKHIREFATSKKRERAANKIQGSIRARAMHGNLREGCAIQIQSMIRASLARRRYARERDREILALEEERARFANDFEDFVKLYEGQAKVEEEEPEIHPPFLAHQQGVEMQETKESADNKSVNRQGSKKTSQLDMMFLGSSTENSNEQITPRRSARTRESFSFASNRETLDPSLLQKQVDVWQMGDA